MRPLIFIIVLLFASTALAQCPGGTCQRPAKEVTKSVLKTTTRTVQKATVRTSRIVPKFRLFRRWR